MTGAALLARTVLALAAVVAMMWALARLGRRNRRGRSRSAAVEVLASRTISRGTSIGVVRVGPKVLVIGTTPQSMGVLTELTPDDLSQLDADGEVCSLPDRPEWSGDSRGPGALGYRRGPGALGYGSNPGPAWMADLVERLRDRTVRRP